MINRALIQKKILRILFYLVIVCVVLIWAFPVLWIIVCSFKEDRLIISQDLVWIFRPTLEHYARIFTTHNFAHFLRNSLLVSVGTTLLVLLTAFPASYSLSRYNTGGMGMTVGILVTRIAPPAAVLMPFFIIFKFMGLLNSLWALILVNISLNMSFALLLLKSFIDEIPISVEEAAKIEGATLFQILRIVISPSGAFRSAHNLNLYLIFTWNEYLYAMVLCSSNRVKTLPVAAGDFVTAYAVEWGPVFASGSLILLPILCLSFVLQKYIVKGLTMGAIK